jgi:pimeloyl-ACP methyl ester carboxylesterase
MVFIEEFADVVEIRPGRRIFLRKILMHGSGLDPSRPTAIHVQLIFVHGLCGTELQYSLLLKSFHELLSSSNDKKYHVSCILYDSIGCGQSPSLPEWDAYSNEECRADFEALFALQNVEGLTVAPSPSLPTLLVGHSYAPSIFLPSLHGRNVEPFLLPNLAGIILINTALRDSQFNIPDGGHVIMRLPVFILNCIQSLLTEGFLNMAVHPDHVELRNEIRRLSQKNDMRVAQAYHRHMEWAHPFHLHKAIWRRKDVVVPTLVLHGANDGLTPVECAQHIHNQLLTTQKSDLVIIDKASHLAMIEQPDQAAKALYDFMEKHIG